MLFMENTPRHAGVVVWGDTHTLMSIHELSHKLWETSAINNEAMKECLMGFSYDIRKCYENKRKFDKVIDLHHRHIPVYGVEISWVELLLAITFMRFCMAYHANLSKEEHAILLSLEYHMESCLKFAFPKDKEQILFTTKTLTHIDYAIIVERLASRCTYFLKLNNKNKRTNQLLWVMQSFTPNFSDDTVNFQDYEIGLFEIIENIKW